MTFETPPHRTREYSKRRPGVYHCLRYRAPGKSDSDDTENAQERDLAFGPSLVQDWFGRCA